MNEIFFNGVWRMDWGLGNPNKTAALIATLMVACWSFAGIRKWGFWAALTSFSALGVGLIHTFSRGGVIALFVGMIPVLYFAPRPWQLSKIIGAIMAIWVIVGAAIYLQADDRLSQGIVQEDRSITNRFQLWKIAPTMMKDAPQGWGIGNAGKAFVEWYQPLDRSETYRTLVNSHLTWLVEFGWPARFIYVLGWTMIFVLTLPGKNRRPLAIPFGVWLAFFVGAFFSSVAESFLLWVVPCIALLLAILWRIRARIWPSNFTWIFFPPSAAFVILLGFYFLAGNSNIHNRGLSVVVGNSEPECWVVIDRKIMGNSYGRTLRRHLLRNPLLSLGLAESVSNLPADNLKEIILVGDSAPIESGNGLSNIEKASSITIVIVNPAYPPTAFPIFTGSHHKILVLTGALAQSSLGMTWSGVATVRELPGVGDFLPDWPEKILAPQKVAP